MKQILLLFLILFSTIVMAQNKIDWSENFQLQLSDFQSPSSQIGGTNYYSISASCGIGFLFSMSNYEFLFTKNFNSKVSCEFVKSNSSLIATDSNMAFEMLSFARYEFDLAELYARKFRQKLYENKGAFSNINFFKPLYDDVQLEYTERGNSAIKETGLGKNKEKLKELHQAVLVEIEVLADFCKTCKPLKKKKR